MKQLDDSYTMDFFEADAYLFDLVKGLLL
ncbi:hypothetical protein THIOSC13_840002 [uncultured Thiomicrorhabdus sp.]